MLKYGQLHDALTSASRRHDELRKRFGEFTKQVESQLNADAFPIKGITVTPSTDYAGFSVAFAGRDLRFVFTSKHNGSSVLRGVVTCFISRNIPETKLIQVGEFSFDGRGKSDLNDPEDNEGLQIDYDLSAIYMALHFVHESLVH